MRIIHTDNFNGDYPDERFVEGLPGSLPRIALLNICVIINDELGDNASRFYTVVEDGYVLKGGFEP